MKRCVYTIPAGLSFVESLAEGILQKAGDDPLALARMQILLPTRRACRSLREAFLKLSNGKPLLLPRMNPIGDVDEEDLSLTLAGMEEELALPPALPPLRRQFMLVKLIGKLGMDRGIEQDMMLASALGRLMDQIYTEDLDLADLPSIVDRADFATHWQVSLDFLAILSEHWPLILAEQGMIDAADRRNRLLKKMGEHWQKNPPNHSIIAAGSTGSIPATAALLKTIANLPDGCIVLPGLDQGMDEDSWKAMDDTHPQATLRHLLQTLDVARQDVAVWDAAKDAAKNSAAMRALSTEILRPADTAQEWQTITSRIKLSPDDLKVERYDCANPQEEALVIALTLRGVLEDKTKTAALVTPDRRLARRVAMACRRWGIEIDDSAGQSLTETRVGTYLRLAMEALCDEMKPVALLNFCKHALCLPESYKDWRGAVRALDISAFRGPAFRGGMEAYQSRLAEREARDKPVKHLRHTLAYIEKAFKPLLDLAKQDKALPFSQWCNAHIEVAEFFCAPDILWAGQDGEAATVFFSDLAEQSDLLPDVTGDEYLSILEQAMKGIAVRPAFGLHPRLMILGQLEARLVEADVMVLSGLNEKTWPPDPGIDPWMSRPMRKRFGLPPLERAIGLSAHDFVQSLCAARVILTRSLRVDGTPTVPSRWLQRMDTVLQACGFNPDIIRNGPALAQARQMDHTEEYKPWERPEPRPPVESRPRQLSVTKIETWMTDPYGIYARSILNLRPLDPLEQTLDAAMRGTLIHRTLEKFGKAFPDHLPPDAQENFMTIAKAELDTLALESDIRSFWEPRLSKIAGWLVDTEKSWRADKKPAKFEAEGKITFDGPAGLFTLTARADRIDASRDGTSGAIIDYKSGGTFSPAGMKDGRFPQLPLEALILEQGAFESIKALPVTSLSYWVVNGSKQGGEIKKMEKASDLTIAKDNARQGLQDLIDTFDRVETPYYSLPRPEKAPRFNDYKHLARVLEWTALDDQEDAA